jgi:hypothetical protein
LGEKSKKESKRKRKANGLRSMGLLFKMMKVKKQTHPAQWVGLKAKWGGFGRVNYPSLHNLWV